MKRGCFKFLLSCFSALLIGCHSSSPSQSTFACYALSPGQTVALETRFGGWPAGYWLTEDPSSTNSSIEYKVQIPVQFVPSSQIPPTEESMRNLEIGAQACLDEAAPYLRGPKNEKLSLELVTGNSGYNLKTRVIEVTAQQKIRGHATLWSTAWVNDCPTVLHETLHLVGLIDAYPDPNHPMRSKGRKDAIMVDPQLAYSRAYSGSSLLYPSEFNAIIAPHCESSRMYSQCAMNAYDDKADVSQSCRNPEEWYM